MATPIYGVPIFLALAIVCFLVVLGIGLLRGGGRRRVPDDGPAAMRSGGSSMLQTLAAILGIISFVMQVLQWLKIM